MLQFLWSLWWLRIILLSFFVLQQICVVVDRMLNAHHGTTRASCGILVEEGEVELEEGKGSWVRYLRGITVLLLKTINSYLNGLKLVTTCKTLAFSTNSFVDGKYLPPTTHLTILCTTLISLLLHSTTKHQATTNNKNKQYHAPKEKV